MTSSAATAEIEVDGTFVGNTPTTLSWRPASIASTPGGLIVFTTDERYAAPTPVGTAAGPALFTWDPHHVVDATLSEAPGTANQWERLVLRVNSNKLTACVIEWARKE